ncbi:hypothetical protein JKP88DRAFT_351004 [Tribonema minus]|uniref:Uncharacterized protein n=1 Tax=Tribonema minus TaxID=303371 RepID=A0A836C8S6_9STRA|nr:hypothetical protein JKP88DRAFT_351004 [Tribonema minus]
MAHRERQIYVFTEILSPLRKKGSDAPAGIIYVFPAIMFLSPLRKKARDGVVKLAGKRRFKAIVRDGVVKLAGKRRFEAIGNYGVVGIGIIMGLLGAIISVLESFFPHILGAAAARHETRGAAHSSAPLYCVARCQAALDCRAHAAAFADIGLGGGGGSGGGGLGGGSGGGGLGGGSGGSSDVERRWVRQM